MAVNFDLLDPNAFQRGFEQGRAPFEEIRARREQQSFANALAALQANPGDTNALAQVTQVAPEFGFRIGQDMRAQQQAGRERLLKVVGTLAKNSKDPQSWDAAVDYLASQGIEGAAQYKGQFSPQMRAAIMAEAGIEDDTADPTTLQRDYEFLNSIDPALGQQFLQRRTAEPPMIASNGDGTFTIIPRSQFAPQQGAATAPPPEAVAELRANPNTAAQFDEIFGPGAAASVLGGASPSNGSPTFP